MSDLRPATPLPFLPTGDPATDAETAALLLDEAVTRRVALCLRPDMDGQDVLHRAERVVLDVTVRDLLTLVDAYDRTVSADRAGDGDGQVGR